ncbi:MAG: alpha-glucosidase [Nocardioidaceae bacterium]|nr:alpha-glucosidase [Nocardioidaceae bacterium]
MSNPEQVTPVVGAEWWRSAVVYQIYPRSFADSDGDGIGDLNGITEHLGHLAGLGVDVIWLSPVYPSPQDDNGYDISDYRDIEPTFGTLEDFDRLLAAVHDRGMKLVMDLVVNHTSDEHPWFVESRSSRDNPKRDWYWWRPPRHGHEAGSPGAEPTNWESFFSGPAWEYDDHTGDYYMHLFSRKQPDLNWENPEVRRAVYDAMTWWLDRGVDGFRMDVINLISKDLSSGGLPDGATRDDRTLGAGAPHFTDGPRVHEYLAEMNRAVFASRGSTYLRVAETPGVTTEHAVLYTDPARGEVDMVFQFEHVNIDHGVTKWDVRPLDLVALKASMDRWQQALAPTGWNSLYWDNHDQPRVVSRFGDDGQFRVESAKLLATVLHLHRGTPYIYQGEELGMANVGYTSIDQLRDLESLNHFAHAVAEGADPEQVLAGICAMGRDNARTPMQWDGSQHAGFTQGTPWIEANPDYVDVNAAAQVDEPESVYTHYRRLIALRHNDPVVVHGDFTMLAREHPTLYAFTRTLGDRSLLVVANFSGDELTLDHRELDGWADASLVLGNHPGKGTASVLRPWEARILRQPLPVESPTPPR